MFGLFSPLKFPLNANVLQLEVLGKKSGEGRVVPARTSSTEWFRIVRDPDTAPEPLGGTLVE